MNGVFISYRRDDTYARTQYLHHLLSEALPHHQIFLDIDNIEPGELFQPVIDKTLGSCRVVLVLIGSDWVLPARGGQVRLHAADDFHRREIASALNSDAIVIPVLVDGAPVPSRDSLPDDLRALLEIQAFRLGDSSLSFAAFKKDACALADRLERLLGPPSPPAPPPRPQPDPLQRVWVHSQAEPRPQPLEVIPDPPGAWSPLPVPRRNPGLGFAVLAIVLLVLTCGWASALILLMFAVAKPRRSTIAGLLVYVMIFAVGLAIFLPANAANDDIGRSGSSTETIGSVIMWTANGAASIHSLFLIFRTWIRVPAAQGVARSTVPPQS